MTTLGLWLGAAAIVAVSFESLFVAAILLLASAWLLS